MRKAWAVTVLWLLLIVPMATVAMQSNIIKKSFEKNVEVRIHNKNVLRNYHSSPFYTMMQTNESSDLDIEKLIDYIESLRTDYGAFPLRKYDDAYINATFYGIMALYLVGKIEDVTGEDLSNFLKLLYAEDIGGFRDWIGGNVSIKATAYALMVMNLTMVDFDSFNKTRTEQYLLSHVTDTGIAENNSSPDLYTTVLGVLALQLLKSQKANFTRLAEIMEKYYSDGVFEDNSTAVSNLVETFFAIRVLSVIDEQFVEKEKEKIITTILKKWAHWGSNNFWVGFGEKEPSVFETGLATDLLYALGYENSSLYEKIIIFVNESQSAVGGIKKSPLDSNGENIFQAFGAILTYLVTGIYENYLKFEHEVSPGEQIAIDYPELIEVRVKALFINNDLDNFELRYSLQPVGEKGYLIFDNVSEYFVTFVPNILGFGNFTLSIELSQAFPLFAKRAFMYHASFRVGYQLEILVSKTAHPGESVLIRTNVTYANGSFPQEGRVSISIHYSEEEVLTYTDLINKTVEIKWNVSPTAPLGYYRIEFRVNDSHGSNHTFARRNILINDSILISYEGLKEEYSLGSPLQFNISLRYNSSGMEIPSRSNVSLELEYEEGTWIKIKGSWVDRGLLVINDSLPARLPPSETFIAELRIVWQENFAQQYQLFQLNITLNDLAIRLADQAKGLEFVLGEQIILYAELLANNSGARIENASINLKVLGTGEFSNMTWDIVKLVYNESQKIYLANFTVNPNIPAGNVSLEFEIFLPHNNSRTIIRLIDGKNRLRVNVIGYPELENIIKPPVAYVEEEVTIDLIVVCNITKKPLSDLVIVANVSKGEITEKIGLYEVGVGVYRFSFIPKEQGEYNITIYRASDKFLLGSLSLSVKERKGVLARFFEAYGSILMGSLIVGLSILYVFVWIYFGGKIPKRYLLRKREKK
ncbi:MAG: prenyltransferase/squalene oxidase repeat-containing protein [Candidatus Njordarchaeales archaeon]